jgi:drug/metabolite transporter (DMT)-like permease
VSAASLALLLFAVASAATGQVILKHGMNLVTASTATTPLPLRAITSPWVLGGLAVFGISAVAWLTTLSRLPLSVAYPFNALGYLAILGASALLLHERTNYWTWLGTGLVAAGLLLVVLTKP